MRPLFPREVESPLALVDQLGDEAHVDRLIQAIEGLAAMDTQTLIVRIATTSDPRVLWALHEELDRRDIAPCLRWPANVTTEQARFLTFLADLLWLTRRHPDQSPQYRVWRNLFTQAPDSFGWHEVALSAYLYVVVRFSVAHYCARGIGLADRQRQDLMVLVTQATLKLRRKLQPERAAAAFERLLTHAIAQPDKSGIHRPEAVAGRRASLWKTFVLSGMNKAATARHWELLTGEVLSRQAVTKHLDNVASVLRVQT